jgi:hypothetical protein
MRQALGGKGPMGSPIASARWRVLEPLIDEALERRGADRHAFLAMLDTASRQEIEAIVAECERSSVLDVPAVERFATLLVEQREPPPVLGDRYTIERVLGRGGMATVYLAQDSQHARPVAVKVLSADVAASMTRERFSMEIRIAARLTHPHILGLHDSGETDGHLFYVMPYVDGESLRHRLRRERCLPVADAIAIAVEIADALSYAHANGVIHRDIKPENVLLESGHAVVADFGIAQALDAASLGGGSGTGMATGTPAYMSPEQATGGVVDHRSDLYSLACVLHEMLTGEPPFPGANVETVVQQHLTTVPPSVAALRPETPEWVAGAIARALEKRPADRFHDIELFVKALTSPSDAALSSRSGVALRGGVTAIETGWSRLAVTAIALGALATVLSVPPSRQAAPTSVAPNVSDRGAKRAPLIPTTPEASEAYANGVYYLSRRTADDRKRAAAELERAVRLAPDFAPAHARLGEAYAALGYFGYPGAPPASIAFAKAHAAVGRALALDSSIAHAYLTRAQLHWMHAPSIRDAEQAIHKALALDSLVAESHFEHARILAMRLQADSALAEVTHARSLDGGSSVRRADIAWVYWVVRRYGQAVGARGRWRSIQRHLPRIWHLAAA